MFLSIQMPTLEDIIAIVITLLVIFGFITYRRYKKRKEDEELGTHNSPIVITSKTSPKEPPVEKIIEKTTDPIEMIAEELDLCIWEVKMALGIPITGVCPANTAVEAEEAYDEAEENSEKEFLALKRWIELEEDLSEIERISDIVEDQPYLEKMCDEKWNDLALKDAQTKNTESELIEAWENYPQNAFEANAVIVKKLYELYK